MDTKAAEQNVRAGFSTRLNHRSLERKNLDEEEDARNHQRGTQGVECGSPWTSTVIPSDTVLPSDDHADKQTEDAERVQNIPLVSEEPANVPIHLAPFPQHSRLRKPKRAARNNKAKYLEYHSLGTFPFMLADAI